MGLRWSDGRVTGQSPHLREVSEIIEFLARQPAPEEILNLKPSDELAQRVSLLLEKNRSERLSFQEQGEWRQ